MQAVLDKPNMELGKLSSKGQITIPAAIRKYLGISTGDKIMFTANDDGTVTMRNATLEAFLEARRAFVGAAEEAGLETEEDVVDMIKSLRAEKAGK